MPTRPTATAEPVIKLLPYQQAAVESPARFRWSCWSRQTGKSFTQSLRRVLRGLQRRRTQVFLSAGERQSRELMAKARQHCQALKIAADYCDTRFFRDLSIKQLEITLPGGVRIIGLPANPQTARGFTGDVFLDEFAMHADDRAIWAAMFPTLLRGQGELDVASTPKGCSNLFAQLRDNDQFERTTVTLPDAIAQGLKADEDALRAALGDEELYQQEFLCAFLDETTAFLTYEQIAACSDPQLVPHSDIASLARATGDLYAGVDIGRHRDLTVIWVLARQGDLLTTVGWLERARLPFAAQQQLLDELLALPHLRRVCIDAGGVGMQLAEQSMQRHGAQRVEAVTFTPAVKSELAVSLRIAVEAQRLRLPADERIRNDLHAVQRRVSPTGQFQLTAPRVAGSHADRFWAAALAVRAAGAATGPAEVRVGQSFAFSRAGAW